LGTVCIDDGAVKALLQGRSLLPAGITDVQGEFSRGDAITVRDTHGHEIGRGLSAYDSHDARIIKGHSSREIEQLLGYSGRAEMIHRDDLVLKKP
ncbi:MAG: PUA domain-containing protein, partial [Parvibaculum sp.]